MPVLLEALWAVGKADSRCGALSHSHSIPGLLLCILALQLCLQDSLATAVHNTAASTMVTATKNTSAATKNTLVGVVTTKKASLVAVTTKNTSVATQNAAVVVVTKNTSVIAMATKNTSAATKNTSVMAMATKNISVATNNTSVLVKATKNALAATKNTPVMAMTTKNASAATKNGLVVVASTKEASAATKNTSEVMVTNNASLVATNTSVKGAEETMQTCQSFQCSGERCYQDAAHTNRTTTCHNETYCELYRFSSTNYTARCSGGCSVEPCSTNSSVSRQQCALECCAGPLCLQLNASAYGIAQLRSAVEMGDGWGESWRGCGCTSAALSLELGEGQGGSSDCYVSSAGESGPVWLWRIPCGLWPASQGSSCVCR
ncbi:uncharacterized protein LOC111939011 isoform X2 [Cyanistes caeruleus]|uniref:uncharacterized protein LOC111939011 isoform X2 n=1 Tax=Cyanistes caeruleus TaxID=156563 RepID=UPI000CDB3DCC|nr:uncharacterized protein LOC111939011 isoform X2 [Cyanistes caeruleus]